MTRLPTHVLHSRVQQVRNTLAGGGPFKPAVIDRLVDQLDSVLGELVERGRDEVAATSLSEGEERR
jgi:hypothetical protein